jgi:hypothetical protein
LNGAVVTEGIAKTGRIVLFISKGTPEDDDFVLWLAPRLEAQGYRIFADILTLEAGDRWRREITGTLQTKAFKMLLCCRDATLAKAGVQEEIGIAEDLAKELKDPRFIIPLRLEKFKKLFGIGELQYVNFEGRWAAGLIELLDTLETQGVPHDPNGIEISPNWQNYRKRCAIKIEDGPEPLTSNWLRIAEIPDTIRYFQPSGAINLQALLQESRNSRYPAEPYLRGFFSFCDLAAVNEAFQKFGRFSIAADIPIAEFLDKGVESVGLRGRDASNIVISLLRQAWQKFCREWNLYEYLWSKDSGFHVTDKHIPLGKKIPWGTQGEHRSSMLRNIAQGKVWQFGVTAIPALWPFPHFKLKSRVLFAEAHGEKAGPVFDDKDLQHRYRRGVCKGWRNKHWHGRLRAFLDLLTGEQSGIKLPLGPTEFVRLDPLPIFFTSPVTTALPDVAHDEDEDHDDSTLTGRVTHDEEGK